jgi:hypothetical protein
MIRRDAFINKIRSLNYSYKDQLKRTQLYRKDGGTHCIYVPLRDLLEDEFVRSALSQAGVSSTEIEQFLSQYRISDSA